MGIFTDGEGPKIETLWWNLMDYALKKKLSLEITKHIKSLGENKKTLNYLYVKLRPIDRKPDTIWAEFDLHFEKSLYFKAKKFIDDYSTSN